jgi:hypothetical protein
MLASSCEAGWQGVVVVCVYVERSEGELSATLSPMYLKPIAVNRGTCHRRARKTVVGVVVIREVLYSPSCGPLIP